MPAGGERVHDDFVVAGEFAVYRGGGDDALLPGVGSEHDDGEDEEFLHIVSTSN